MIQFAATTLAFLLASAFMPRASEKLFSFVECAFAKNAAEGALEEVYRGF